VIGDTSGFQQQTGVSETLSEEVIRALRPVPTAKPHKRIVNCIVIGLKSYTF